MPAFRNVATGFAVSTSNKGVPQSVAVTASNLAPNGSVKFVVNGATQATWALDSTGALSQSWHVTAALQTAVALLGGNGGATFGAGVDNGSGVVFSAGASDGTTTLTMELSY